MSRGSRGIWWLPLIVMVGIGIGSLAAACENSADSIECSWNGESMECVR